MVSVIVYIVDRLYYAGNCSTTHAQFTAVCEKIACAMMQKYFRPTATVAEYGTVRDFALETSPLETQRWIRA